ncbi:hypothetical protein [Alteromonas sp. P256]|uniref:hypothetical protein n=1 Tax=Alteromonas sp. P256 TaxID=3117399 RepID=UPI002FE394EB
MLKKYQAKSYTAIPVFCQKYAKLAVLLSAVVSPFAMASSYIPSTGNAADTATNETIEVLGKRPVSYYRSKLHDAQVSFFKTYNTVAEKSGYKVKCKPWENNLNHRGCQALFVNEILDEYRIEFLNSSFHNGRLIGAGEVGSTSYRISQSELQKKMQEAQAAQYEDMKEKIETVDEVKASFTELARAKMRYAKRISQEQSE